MIEDVTILSLADRERWVAEQQDGGLPSQSWHYALGMSVSGVDPKLAVVRSKGARMLMPFYERAWNGTIDIATLLGLSGASIVPSSSAPLQLWREYAASRGWVAGYIQLSAGVTGEETWEESVVQTNTVFWLSLRDIHLNALSPTIRQRIRKAEKQNVTLVPDRNVLLPSLKTLYPTTMQRVASPPHYHFSPETLEVWASDHTSLVLGARVAGSIEAVSLFLVSGTHAEYHLNASTEDGRDLAAWLIWNAVLILQAKEVPVLDLGGGVRPGDGVYRFKERFHGIPKPLLSVRQIYNSAKYDSLCREAGVSTSTAYFPAYRAARQNAP